ncbi:MAG: 2,3-diphosphoglycerate-dependent phosphoglycerate mutase [Actinobacteria bacterium]|nr:2,3-diphosphoglycerate-dependent phosphoglycerate mutase [Actinomycetota bacterium]
MAYLALVRHGESTWNEVDAWTGLTNIGLSEEGFKESKKAGKLLKDINFQIAFTSKLIRAKQTLEEILDVLNIEHIPIYENAALNERDYGDFTGKNKLEVEKDYGEKKYHDIRRGWDVPIPNGETLKDVYERVVPYYQEHILPKLKAGKNVLVAAHGNSLRALIKYLDHISDKDIPNFEMETGAVFVYDISQSGEVIGKQVRIP